MSAMPGQDNAAASRRVILLFPVHPSTSRLYWAAPASRADCQLGPCGCSPKVQHARESVQLQSRLHSPTRCTVQVFGATQVLREICNGTPVHSRMA